VRDWIAILLEVLYYNVERDIRSSKIREIPIRSLLDDHVLQPGLGIGAAVAADSISASLCEDFSCFQMESCLLEMMHNFG
jgi:hypothetical protein